MVLMKMYIFIKNEFALSSKFIFSKKSYVFVAILQETVYNKLKNQIVLEVVLMKKKPLSDRALRVNPSATLKIDAEFKRMLAAGMDVVGFGAGEPDFDTPDYIKEAAHEAIQQGKTKYTPASGILDLKKAVCLKLKNDNGLDYEPSQIVISNGAKQSLYNALTVIVNPGDEVILPAPYWVSYYELIRMAGGTPVTIMGEEKNDFQITKEQVLNAVSDKTKAIIITNPSNPTGMMFSNKMLSDIAQICVNNGIYVISDEIYEKLVYDDEKHISIASLGDEIKDLTILINGVSKTYAMTGWRIGYSASNKEIASHLSAYQSHSTSNPNTIAQYAALKALSHDDGSINMMKEAFKKRRDYMVERINTLPYVSCRKPTGAFYVLMNVEKLFDKKYKGEVIGNVDNLCSLLLKNKLLSVVPGTAFAAPSYVRWSYATSMENIKKGLDRLEQFLSEITD